MAEVTDNLANDLLNILEFLDPEDQDKILGELTPYIVRRDHMIFDHAYKKGQENAVQSSNDS